MGSKSCLPTDGRTGSALSSPAPTLKVGTSGAISPAFHSTGKCFARRTSEDGHDQSQVSARSSSGWGEFELPGK
jgi:hypothetical protein